MSSISESDQTVLDDIEKKTGVSYNPDTDTAEFASAPSDTEQYVSLVEYLLANGFIEERDLPISAARAQTRYLINTTNAHEDRDMIRPRTVGDGLFVETNHDSTSKARYAGRFIREYVLGQ